MNKLYFCSLVFLWGANLNTPAGEDQSATHAAANYRGPKPYTAEYTNAVLNTFLPIVEDFCRQLDIPCPKPLTTNHVTKVGVGYRKVGELEAGLKLTNGNTFEFAHGFVDSFCAPTSYLCNCWRVQDTPAYTGEVRVTLKAAVPYVRERLERLGIPALTGLVQGKPHATGDALSTNGYTIPYLTIGWSSPTADCFVDVEFDANRGRIDKVFMSSWKFNRPAPLKVEPPMAADLDEPARQSK